LVQRDPEGKEKQFIADVIGPPWGTVLEVGCGDGRLTAAIAKACPKLIALEPDLSLLGKAHDLLPGSVLFLSGSGEDIPLADGCVETVVFSLSLHHLDAARGLSEARRVLRGEGRILVLEPVQDSLMTRLFSFVHDESWEYAQSETAIGKSCFKIMHSGVIRTKWVFGDFVELADYIFGYYGLPTDLEIKHDMEELLGKRVALQPLGIEDVTRFWLLGE
jgi:ubiquinone/menaquinone biosynthesis C-methylase UbiE